MKIIIPLFFSGERIYVVKTIFNNFLNIDIEIEQNDVKGYSIILNNGSVIEIEDHFFFKYGNNSYLKSEALPANVMFLQSTFCVEKDIPVLYGIPEVNIIKGKENKILVRFDIIASIYFMLSRWEEFVNPIRDSHTRFPLTESIAYKFNFFKRPIVNEYVEFLWNIIKRLDDSQIRKQRQFTFRLTHDIDSIFCSPPSIRSLAKILIKNQNISGFFKTLYFQTFNNPHDSFNYLMDLSEKANTRSVFYFMADRTHELDFEDYLDSKLFKQRVQEIKSRGHSIGLHPSYNTYNNPELLCSEKIKLESAVGMEIEEVRQHFLRVEIPGTFINQEFCGFKRDSTLGYVEDIGFRCGICNEIPIFDFLSGKQLKIVQTPLIVMEGSLIHYKKLSPQKVLNEIIRIIDTVKKYNGEFVFLWHNTSFNKEPWFKHQHIYLSVLNYLNGK